MAQMNNVVTMMCSGGNWQMGWGQQVQWQLYLPIYLKPQWGTLQWLVCWKLVKPTNTQSASEEQSSKKQRKQDTYFTWFPSCVVEYIHDLHQFSQYIEEEWSTVISVLYSKYINNLRFTSQNTVIPLSEKLKLHRIRQTQHYARVIGKGSLQNQTTTIKIIRASPALLF